MIPLTAPALIDRLFAVELDLAQLALELGAFHPCPAAVADAAVAATRSVTHLRQHITAAIESGDLTLPPQE